MRHRWLKGLQVKIWAVLALTMLGAFLLIQFHNYQTLQASVREQAIEEARHLRAVLMATRRVYHQQFIESGLPLTDATVGFLPAHALSRISDDLPNWTDSGRLFRNVSIGARNPQNEADAADREAIRFFESHTEEVERLVRVEDPVIGDIFHYSQPIRTEAYCLKCHGSASEAPPTIRTRYDAGYGWEVGDVQGLLNIRLSAARIERRAHDVLVQGMHDQAIVFALTLLLGGWLLNRFVVLRLERLDWGMERVGGGHYGERIDLGGDDEISDLAAGFNRMATMLGARERQLQETQRAAHIGSWRYTSDGRCSWSPEIQRIFGVSGMQAPSREQVRPFLHPEDVDRVFSVLDRAMSAGERFEQEYRIRRPDGGERWIHCQGQVMTASPDGGSRLRVFCRMSPSARGPSSR
jgi:PAS domain S-box-containing protein